jgi:hypothetical protein
LLRSRSAFGTAKQISPIVITALMTRWIDCSGPSCWGFGTTPASAVFKKRC